MPDPGRGASPPVRQQPARSPRGSCPGHAQQQQSFELRRRPRLHHDDPFGIAPAFDFRSSRPRTADFPEPGGPVRTVRLGPASRHHATSLRTTEVRPVKYQPVSPTSTPRAASVSASGIWIRRRAVSTSVGSVARNRGFGTNRSPHPPVHGCGGCHPGPISARIAVSTASRRSPALIHSSWSLQRRAAGTAPVRITRQGATEDRLLRLLQRMRRRITARNCCCPGRAVRPASDATTCSAIVRAPSLE